MGTTEIKGVTVEWDDQKNKDNKKKHGISFDAAAYVFGDDNRIEIYDEAHSFEEDRYQVIGMAGCLVFAVYTVRGERHRIISARIADSNEKRFYYGNHKSYN